MYEKYGQQSLLMAISQEGSDQFQNPSVVQVLDMEATRVPNFKSIGPSLRDRRNNGITDKASTIAPFKLSLENALKIRRVS